MQVLRSTFLITVFGVSLMLVGCDSGSKSQEEARFRNVHTWESTLHVRLARRFREAVGEVHCTGVGLSSPDHLFCRATFPDTPAGKCGTRAYDVAGRPRSLLVRPATEQWYCVVLVPATDF